MRPLDMAFIGAGVLQVVFVTAWGIERARANDRLYPVALVCLGAIDPSECVPQTAVSVITSMEPSALPSMCLTYAEEQLAPTAVVKPGDYVKIMCERRS